MWGNNLGKMAKTELDYKIISGTKQWRGHGTNHIFGQLGKGGGRGITPETLGMHHALLPCFQSKPLLQVSTSRETSSTAKVFARTFIHCQVFFLEKSSILGNKDYNKVINTKGLIMIVGR